MKPLLLLFSGLILSGIVFNAYSCKKNTECKAKVRCIDSASANVSEANVLLYAAVKSPDGKTTYTADLKAEGRTGGDGTVEFLFELPAIYDVRATKIVGTKTLTGVGIIKLEEGKTVEKTVTLK
jgi:hypothetical protein